MKRPMCVLAAGLVATVLFPGCGANPFGRGYSGGLSLFAKIAQAIEKPSSINKEENGKDGAKDVVTAGQLVKRLAKASVGTLEPGVVENGLLHRGDTLVYYEIALDKPCSDDPDKRVTGRGEVAFGYNGTVDSLSQIVETNITDVYSWKFVGREVKTWSSEVCTLQALVTFGATAIADPKPGRTYLWGKNISATLELGRDDTTAFVLDSLDDTNHIQYGEGHYLDAHKGDDPNQSSAFSYSIQIIHKNTLDPSRPYQRWEDNEGIVGFVLPWGASGIDSLHFSVHFYPDYRRTGEIKDQNGTVRVRFIKYEKPGIGSDEVHYYDEHGTEVRS